MAERTTVHLVRHGEVFNPEKLLWLNQQHLMRSDPKKIVPYLKPHLVRLGIECADNALLERIVIAQRERVKTLKEMAENSRYFFGDTVALDEKAATKHLTVEAKALLQGFAAELQTIAKWEALQLHETLKSFAEKHALGLGKIAQPLRVAVTGKTVGLGLYDCLAILGRERALERLGRAQPRCG